MGLTTKIQVNSIRRTKHYDWPRQSECTDTMTWLQHFCLACLLHRHKPNTIWNLTSTYTTTTKAHHHYYWISQHTQVGEHFINWKSQLSRETKLSQKTKISPRTETSHRPMRPHKFEHLSVQLRLIVYYYSQYVYNYMSLNFTLLHSPILKFGFSQDPITLSTK